MISRVLMGALALLWVSLAGSARAAERPNFLWILSEDNSIHYMKLYGAEHGVTPNIEALGKEGIVFNQAFSCAPVCSVARTTLMTGIYAPRVGSQYHRRAELATLPPGVQMWPAYLREAGYHTSNNSKKDYNVHEGQVWDESGRKASWRNRPDAATPFFHMRTVTTTHESSLHFNEATFRNEKTQTDPAKVSLPPYFPDTPLFRYTMARYFDKMRAFDAQLGEIVEELKADGQLENTFIFYFGDHGGVLPRGKGYIYESGLHVPLVVRIPEKWRHLVSQKPGSREDGSVQFIDFGPTLLHLAGLPVPKELDGRPILGKGVSLADRKESFGYGDRFDEKYDLSRSVRVGRFHYIRNYEPFYPDGLHNQYRYKMLAYEQWWELHRKGELNPVQDAFFMRKPVEMLFDVEQDPHEVRNLAADPKHQKTLLQLRARLQSELHRWNDLSFLPESVMVEEALEDGIGYGRQHSARIHRLMAIADLQLLPWKDAQAGITAALGSKDPLERYWGLITCSAFGEQARPLVHLAKPLLQDTDLMVRTRAAEFLGILRAVDPRPALYSVLNETRSQVQALLTLNTVAFLMDEEPGYGFDPASIKLQIKPGECTRRLEYLTERQSWVK